MGELLKNTLLWNPIVISDATDANNINTMAVAFNQKGSLANCPTEGNGYGTLFCISVPGEGHLWQIYDTASRSSAMYLRSCSANIWTAWVKIATT